MHIAAKCLNAFVLFTILWTGTFLHDVAGQQLERLLSGRPCPIVASAKGFTEHKCPCPAHVHSPYAITRPEIALLPTLDLPLPLLLDHVADLQVEVVHKPGDSYEFAANPPPAPCGRYIFYRALLT